MKIDADLIETSIKAAIGSALLEPDSLIIERKDWYQILTPSIKNPSLNEVILSRITDSKADEAISKTFAAYQNHGLPFKWCIGPMSNSQAIEPKIKNKA